MTDEQIIQATRAIVLPIIVFLVTAIALRQLARVRRHWRHGTEQPEILTRDVLFFWGLAFLFTVPPLAGVFGIILGTIPAWVILSSSVAVLLLAVFAYYEFAVIGHASDQRFSDMEHRMDAAEQRTTDEMVRTDEHQEVQDERIEVLEP